MQDHDQVRREVAEAYARAVSASPPAACGAGPRKGRAVRFAGYPEEALRDLPEVSVVNAFGCGNPLSIADVRPGQVVLDLGSGAGLDVLLAARAVGPKGRAIGVDMTGPMIETARRAIAAAGMSQAEIREGLIEDLPVASASVDHVISNCVINLSPEKDRVFREIARVLRPGGNLRISDLVVEDLPERLHQDAALWSSCLAGAISEERYLQGLRDAGLEDVRVAGRIVYDRAQLEAMAGAISGELVGRVWSALFTARKPAAQPCRPSPSP